MAKTDRDTAYHHGNLRQALLLAARGLLEEKGASGLALREIARRVGVTPPAAYHHFRNLDAIFVGLAQMAETELLATIDTAAGEAQDTRLMAIGKSYVAFAASNPQLYRLLFGEGLAVESPARAEVGKLKREVFDRIADEMRRRGETGQMVERGVFGWSVVHGISMLIIDGQLPSDQTEHLIDSVLRMTGKALRPILD